MKTPAPNSVTCEACRRLLSDALDGAALPDAARRHRETCAACAAFGHDLHTVRADLRALPRPQTSPQFEAALLARLSTVPTRSFRTAARSFVRPVVALSACASLIGAAFFVRPAPIAPPPIPAITAADPSLVGHCVAQHRADLAAQPLSDPAAQALSDHLTSASADAALESGL